MESNRSSKIHDEQIDIRSITYRLSLNTEEDINSRLQLADTTYEEDATARPSTSFFCAKLNVTTFLIIEDDSYGEQPHIYIKIYPDVIFISDTGCNSPRQKNKTITSLRQYLETFPTPANENIPLNPHGTKPYLILCTHCHYDHILGIPPFISSLSSFSSSSTCTSTATILASSHSKPFIQEDLPTHSLCKYLHIPTPTYPISHWARHLEYLSYRPPPPPPPPSPSPAPAPAPAPPPPPLGVTHNDPTTTHPLRIQLLHIPGHTPDSLAWYDIDAHHLYIGDTFYARKRRAECAFAVLAAGALPAVDDAAIIFPPEGSWVDYMASLALLLSFIRHQNSRLRQWRRRQWPSGWGDGASRVDGVWPRVKLAAGHVTASGDAEAMAVEVKGLFERIIEGSVPVTRSEVRRGEVFDYWCEGEEARFSVLAPRRLVEEARRHFKEEGVVV